MRRYGLDRWDIIIGITMISWGFVQLTGFVWISSLPFPIGPVFVFIYLLSGFLIGAIFVFGGLFVLLLKAFQVSMYWGLICMIFPVAALVFAFTHWSRSWRPFLTTLLGVAAYIWSMGTIANLGL